MSKVFAAIAIALALVLAGVTAYFALPAGSLAQLPGLLDFGAPIGPTVQLTYAVNQDAVRDDRLEEASDRMAATLRGATPSILYNGRGVRDGVATISLVDDATRERALRVLDAALARTPEGALVLTFVPGADGVIEARIAPEHLQSLTQAAATQNMRVIRRRIDAIARRVTLRLTSDSRVVVRVAGMDSEAVRGLIGHQGRLTFHLVRELAPEGRAPAGAMLAAPYPGVDASVEAVEQRARLTGEHIARAYPSIDPRTGEWVVGFAFNREGTRLFCRITRDNVGERFAILIDNRVLTAPQINEPICSGTGQISGNFTAQSANELVILLNAGALPAPLVLIDERIDSNPT
jgi:protein-export membrane protein SecD